MPFNVRKAEISRPPGALFSTRIASDTRSARGSYTRGPPGKCSGRRFVIAWSGVVSGYPWRVGQYGQRWKRWLLSGVGEVIVSDMATGCY
jgi:hypothetical protein